MKLGNLQPSIPVFGQAGYSRASIAKALGLDQRTVQNHCKVFGEKTFAEEWVRNLNLPEPDLSDTLRPSYARFRLMYDGTHGKVKIEHLKLALPVVTPKVLGNWVAREQVREKAVKRLFDLYLCLKQEQDLPASKLGNPPEAPGPKPSSGTGYTTGS